jgi:hypothetical protein
MPINNFRNITTTGFDEDALFTFTAGDQVRNFAVVTTTGDLANGVYVGADDVSVDNFGRIETSGAGAEGVLIEGDGARVRNFASITTHGEPTDDFLHFNDAIAVYGDDFRIDNRGNLSTQGSFSQGMVGFGNGGLIRNFGSIVTTGEFFSPAVFAIGDGIQIVNFGSVNTSGVISQGLVAGGDGNRIVNYGVIRVDDPLRLTPAMDATGSQNEVVNFGTITGGGMFAGGSDLLSGFGNMVTNWGSISTGAADPGMLGTGRNALAQNFGTIENFGATALFAGGISALGDMGAQARNTGTITTHGEFGDGLFVSTGADGKAVNAGFIRTHGNGAAGVVVLSDINGEVANSGSIKTLGGLSGTLEAAGVDARGLDVLVHNTRTGSIESLDPNSPAVLVNIRDILPSFGPGVIAADTHGRLENEGLIKAAQTAVLGGPGDETIINSGRIVGDVRLGDGDDTYVAERGGELRGAILSGDGNDMFVFHDGSGRTQVADFEAGAGSDDVLDVSAFGFDSFADVLGAARQDGSDVVIRLDGNDQAVLSNILIGALHQDDFLLIA